jgi:hypothetical protein
LALTDIPSPIFNTPPHPPDGRGIFGSAFFFELNISNLTGPYRPRLRIHQAGIIKLSQAVTCVDILHEITALADHPSLIQIPGPLKYPLVVVTERQTKYE